MTVWTLPRSISEIQRFIDCTTSRASPTGRIPLINEPYGYTFSLGDIHQLLDEISKAQVADLTSPKGFHALWVQILKTDFVIFVRDWCASFQRFFDFFCVRECARLVRLIALILRLKNCGESISCPLRPVRYRFRPKSNPAILPVVSR